MARTIATLTALAALLGALPGATAALAVPSAPLPLGPQPPAIGPADVSDVAGQAAHAAGGAADAATGLLDAVPACQLARLVHSVWYGGTVKDTKAGQAEFLLPYTFVTTTRETVAHRLALPDVPGTGLDVLPQAPNALPAVGYETRITTTRHSVDLDVSAAWQSRYVVWQAVVDDYLLAPAAPVPRAEGVEVGPVHLACDGARVAGAAHSPGGSGYDVQCLCVTRPRDGWYTSVTSLRVSLADAADYARLGFDRAGVPAEVVAAAMLRAGGLHLTPADEAWQAGLRPVAPTRPAVSQASTAEQTAGWDASVAASVAETGAVLAAAVVAALALALRLAARRR